MKFTIPSKTLKTELDFALRVVPKKTTIPVLSCVSIEAGEGVTIRGTDLDLTMICPIDIPVDTPGAIAIHGNLLSKMTKTLDGDITFTLENDRLHLHCGAVDIDLETVPVDQFPLSPDPIPAAFSLSGDDVRRAAKQTIYAATKEQSRFTLAGIQLESDADGIRFISTDGHRLAISDVSGSGPALETLIPVKAMTEVARLANGCVSIGTDADHISFVSDGRTVISRNLKGTFPNYRMVLPTYECPNPVTLDICALKDAVKRASLSADDRNRCMTWTLAENFLRITTETDGAKRSENVAIEYDGEMTVLAFNCDYIADICNTIGSGKASFTFENALAQVMFSIENMRAIVMPLRV